MSAVLEAGELRFSFDSHREVLHGITFSVEEGECVGIVGANGSGKSTLLWCVLGLLKAEGTVRLFGEPMARKSLRRVGVVFQNPEDQLFMPKLVEDVALPLVNRGMPHAEATAKAIESLKLVGLGGAAGRPASQLSLGERKRAAIAGALVTSPELLILDEPTAELDGRSVRQLAALLRNLPVARVIASHHLEFLRGLCARLLVLDGGRIIAAGPASDLIEDAVLMNQAGLI